MSRAPPQGKLRKGERTRRRLLDAAFELFAERGYAATTVRDIAARAGCSPGLLYRYFPTRAMLAIALYESVAEDFDAETKGIPSGPLADRFGAAMHTKVDALRPHRDVFIGLLGATLDPTSDVSVSSAATAPVRERVVGTFRRLIDTSDEPFDDDESEDLAKLLYAAHLAILFLWTQDRSTNAAPTHELVDRVAFALRLVMPLRAALRSQLGELSALISAFLESESNPTNGR